MGRSLTISGMARVNVPDSLWRAAKSVRGIGGPLWQIRFGTATLWEHMGTAARRLHVMPTELQLPFGCRMQAPSVGALDYLCDTYETAVTSLIADILKPGMAFVDLGANVGYYTLLARATVGARGSVYAFEPDPGLFQTLTGNIALNRFHDVEAHEMAVSDSCGVAAFYPAQARVDGSLYAAAGGEGDSLSVRVTTLDAFFSERGWPSLDVIKIDIEGAELPALRGMSEVARRNESLRVIVEFNLRSLHAVGTTPVDLLTALHASGFSRISVIERGLRPVDVPRIDWLVEEAHTEQYNVLNLLCEKA